MSTKSNDIHQFGRLIPESKYKNPEMEGAIRQEVLRQTLQALSCQEKRERYRHLARDNLARWSKAKQTSPTAAVTLKVLSGDWGVVTHQVTKDSGKIFAVLNMASLFSISLIHVEIIVCFLGQCTHLRRGVRGRQAFFLIFRFVFELLLHYNAHLPLFCRYGRSGVFFLQLL